MVGSYGVCVLLLWLLSCVYETDSVKIVKLTVPAVVQFGAQQSATLDCDFTYGNDTRGLVVKWFFPDRLQLAYQWIAGQAPQAAGALRGRVDLAHRAAADPLTAHRALRLVRLAPDLSGDYTCVVSTFMAEDAATKKMTVFSPETSFRLVQNKSDDDSVNVICAADGAYPAPLLTLSTPDRRLEGVRHSAALAGARFSAVAMVTLRDAELPSPAQFVCTLRIPAANYVVRKEALYYPGPISTTPEMPTAADMQLAAAVGSTGSSPSLLSWLLRLALARVLLL